jgi:hypothetical protein
MKTGPKLVGYVKHRDEGGEGTQEGINPGRCATCMYVRDMERLTLLCTATPKTGSPPEPFLWQMGKAQDDSRARCYCTVGVRGSSWLGPEQERVRVSDREEREAMTVRAR